MITIKQEHSQKKSFWEKNKKKIVIGLIILLTLLLIIFVVIDQVRKNKQQELYQAKYTPQQIQANFPEFANEFDKAVKDGNQEKIKILLNQLGKIISQLPAESQEEIKSFLQEQLNNPELLSRHKQEIKNLLTNPQ